MPDLVLCCDKAYLPHLTTALVSVCANASPEASCRAWVVSRNLTDDETRTVRAAVADRRLDLRFIDCDAQRLRDAPVNQHVSIATYYRLLLPWILPAGLERVVYLDCDLVVEHDIAELAAIALDGAVVGAVPNPRFDRWADLEMDPTWGYFNAGVLLIDLAAWRRERISERALAVIAERPGVLKSWDQDALNIAVAGRWRRLDARWNQQHSFWTMRPVETADWKDEHARAIAAPYIVHYSSASKPWQFSNDHPMGRRYHHYRKLAGLPPAVMRPRSWRDVAARAGKLLVPYRYRRVVRQLMNRGLS